MRDVIKLLGAIYDGDCLEDLIELTTCGHNIEIRGGLALLDDRVVTGAWIIFVEGEHDFRNPGRLLVTERQAEDLVRAAHKN
jgi:hypothetical protein